jgi:hypothetical protein
MRTPNYDYDKKRFETFIDAVFAIILTIPPLGEVSRGGKRDGQLRLKNQAMKNTVSSSADCAATPPAACSRILSAEGLAAWWIGHVKITNQDASWPAAGSKMSWKAGGGNFDAQIIEDARPKRVVMKVVTPSADSTITHSFELLPTGGTRYSKTVTGHFRSAASRFFAPLMMRMLKFFVKKEVSKAAAFADRGL